MTKEITKSRQGALTLSMPDEARMIIEKVVSFWPDGGLPAEIRRPLTREERASLDAALVDLNRTLRPISYATEEMKRAAEIIAAMFLGYPSMRNVDAQTMITAYIQHLSDLPLFAVRAACEDVTKGRVKGVDPDWAPTSPRLYEIAQRHVFPVAAQQIQVEKVLAGTVPDPEITPEERERVGAEFHKVAKDAMLRIDEEKSEEVRKTFAAVSKRDERAQLREYDRIGVEPRYADKAKTILISPSLLAAVNPGAVAKKKQGARGR